MLVDIIYYCLQTKFAKVMFSQVFVCPQGGGYLGRYTPSPHTHTQDEVEVQFVIILMFS